MWNALLERVQLKTVHDALLCWQGELGSLVLVSEGINTVYKFKAKDNILFLRITHEKLRPHSELEAAIALQNYLYQSAVPVCQPILSINECYIEKIMQDDDVFLMHVCREVPGSAMHFDFSSHDLYNYWGACLAKLHKANQAFQAQHVYGKWENDIEELNAYLETEPDSVSDIVRSKLDYFSSYPQTADNYGLIHGDHRKANVMTDGRKVYFIDFDLPRYCWFMDDISRPFFSSIAFNDRSWQSKLSTYIAGYNSVKTIKDSDLSTFPHFLHYKAMNIYLWTKYNWDAEIEPGGMKTAVWLDKLHQMIVNDNWKKALAKII